VGGRVGGGGCLFCPWSGFAALVGPEGLVSSFGFGFCLLGAAGCCTTLGAVGSMSIFRLFWGGRVGGGLLVGARVGVGGFLFCLWSGFGGRAGTCPKSMSIRRLLFSHVDSPS